MKLSPRQIIDGLGIPKAVILSGMSRTAIVHWRKNDRVPRWQESTLKALARHLPKRRAKVRTLAEVHAGIEATTKLLVELQQARVKLIEDRDAACLSAFDSGVERRAICELHQITYPALSSLLHRNKRTRKSRIVSGLTLAQRRHFGVLTRKGYTPKQARVIAVAVTEGANA